MSTPDTPPASDAALIEAVKSAHRAFPTGVMIVTTAVNGRPYGLAVNAFSSVSLKPPMVLVCVASTSATYEQMIAVDEIGANVLAHDQLAVARRFAISGGDKFSQVAWSPGANGAPVLDSAAGHFEISVTQRIPMFTHTIFIGRVTAASAHDKPPLIYLGGTFYDGSAMTLAI